MGWGVYGSAVVWVTEKCVVVLAERNHIEEHSPGTGWPVTPIIAVHYRLPGDEGNHHTSRAGGSSLSQVSLLTGHLPMATHDARCSACGCSRLPRGIHYLSGFIL